MAAVDPFASATKLLAELSKGRVSSAELTDLSTAFPAGRSREGLPIGLQAIGPYLEDRTPVHFAHLLARELGGFTKPAGYDLS